MMNKSEYAIILIYVFAMFATLALILIRARRRALNSAQDMHPAKRQAYQPRSGWPAAAFCLGLGVFLPVFMFVIVARISYPGERGSMGFAITLISALAIVGASLVGIKAFGRLESGRNDQVDPLVMKPAPADESFEFAGRVDAR